MVLRRGLVEAEQQYEGRRRGQPVRRQREAGVPPPRSPDLRHQREPDPPRDEDRRIGEPHRQGGRRRQRPEPSDAPGPPPPLDRQPQQCQRHEQVGGIRLHLRDVPERPPRHGEDRHRQQQGDPAQHAPGDVPEQGHARDPAQEREQPQRHLREAEQLDRRELDQEEQDGRDLAEVERPEKIGIAAVEEVRREHRLVAPEGVIQQVADGPHQDPEHDEPRRRPRHPGG